MHSNRISSPLQYDHDLVCVAISSTLMHSGLRLACLQRLLSGSGTVTDHLPPSSSVCSTSSLASFSQHRARACSRRSPPLPDAWPRPPRTYIYPYTTGLTVNSRFVQYNDYSYLWMIAYAFPFDTRTRTPTSLSERKQREKTGKSSKRSPKITGLQASPMSRNERGRHAWRDQKTACGRDTCANVAGNLFVRRTARSVVFRLCGEGRRSKDGKMPVKDQEYTCGNKALQVLPSQLFIETCGAFWAYPEAEASSSMPSHIIPLDRQQMFVN
ncbi:hypothetical protein IW261DRAFT_1596591 [Armillaria novae-zelandiae]|uniref:Uncharacterized protein n=1 Tax=Armillaria novae-zelandiae TaxID=153914 RepID=A0AA39NWD9_9AGAR|nr:hypothetical protein IW261DRAFT_1596591 [Armillaria novae-zelandiae]